jgi:hypothetical protein
MNDSISMFIDNELDLDEKIGFINKIREEDDFYDESISLLEQEKLLRADVVSLVPGVPFEKERRFLNFRYLTPIFRVAEVVAIAAIIFFFVFTFQWGKNDAPISNATSKRFVIYQPEANSVQISGSFTNWNNIPLKMDGTSGYWEIELDVPKGEHKYVFIIGENKKIADPTILMREKDDFGSENSVLVVEA